MNYGFIIGKYFADLLRKASNNTIPDNLLQLTGYLMDALLLIAIGVAIAGFIYQMVKFGIRRINSDNQSQTKEEKIQQKKDILRSMTGFIIVIAVCLLIPTFFALITGLIGI